QELAGLERGRRHRERLTEAEEPAGRLPSPDGERTQILPATGRRSGRPPLQPGGVAVRADGGPGPGRLPLTTRAAADQPDLDLGHVQDADPVRAGDPGLSNGFGGLGDGGAGEPRGAVEVLGGSSAGHPGGTGDLADSEGAGSAGRSPEADANASAGIL